MKTYKRHRTVDEIIKQCMAEGIELDMRKFVSEGHDHIVLTTPAIRVLYNTFSGRFFGTLHAIPGLMDEIEFSSDEDRDDDWYQTLLDFFYTDEDLPA